MRFLSVEFRKFGPFAEQRLNLSEGQHGLHIVYGPNEAGKSSALRGMRFFLFGFPAQMSDNFIFNYPQFRIQAKLADARGGLLECVRRKGTKDTLRAADDKTLIPDQRLREFVGGLDEEQFKLLFGLDQTLLKEGGRTIAVGQGDLGAAIFAAGTGLSGLRELGRKLNQGKELLYKPRGSSQAIAESLRNLKKSHDRVRELTLNPEDYSAKEDLFRSTQASSSRSRQERNEVRAELGRLERCRSALPTISQLQIVRDQMREVQGVRILRDGFEAESRDTSKELITAETSAKKLRLDIEKNKADIDTLAVPAELLSEEDVIDELHNLVAVWTREKEETIEADTRRREMEAKARDIYRELVGSTNLEEAKDYRLRLEESNRIRALVREFTGIEVELRVTITRYSEIKDKIAEADRKLGQAPEPADFAGLRRLTDAVGAEGRLEVRLQQLTVACEREEAGIRSALLRLMPRCPLPLEQIDLLPLPFTEAVELHRQALSKSESGLNRCREDLRQAQFDLAALDAQVAAFVQGQTVPSETELIDKRADRDAGLNQVRMQLAGERSAADEAFIARYAPRRQLIDAVEVSTHDCDGIADRLRHEADRVAQWKTLEARRDEEQKRIALLEADAKRLTQNLDRAQADWQSEWQVPGIVPAAPEVMQSWISQLLRLRERAESWLSAMQERNGLAKRIEQFRLQLCSSISGIESAWSLQLALDAARDHVKALDNAHRLHHDLVEELTRLHLEAMAAEAERTAAENRQWKWQGAWADAVRPLQLDPKTDVVTAETYLDRIDEMQKHLMQARIKAARIREIEADRDMLLNKLCDVRTRIDSTALPSTADSIETDFRALEHSLRSARTKRTNDQQLRRQLGERQTELETAERVLHAAEAKLAALATEAGVTNPDQLPVAIDNSRRRSETERRLGELNVALAHLAQGEPILDFEAAALANREGIDEVIETLNEKIDQINDQIEQAGIDANSANEQLKKWQAASGGAADAHQEAALLARQLQEQVGEFVTLHLARKALDRAVERYRSRHADTLLARAGNYFKCLTNGDFTGLDIENVDGNSVMVAIRSAQARVDAKVTVNGLSDGTRDQLFLALRLAGIEQHIAEREPMPLIMDDVLVSFDDRRAEATLRALAELSSRTQIMLFTHHRFIVDLARAAVPSVVIVHELKPAN